ncbi:unnamed protein product [Linum tenue]|uniref:Ycf2 N-terminal domain-containing protein n=1 Tax=Linum tenue TaxID=586396 RepID=A0AAV0L6K5_9ROSI|nr:unnamed protein product [Linum tenue]
MWQFRQNLFLSWVNNSHEPNFLRNIPREDWIWLDNVWLVNKYCFLAMHGINHPIFNMILQD